VFSSQSANDSLKLMADKDLGQPRVEAGSNTSTVTLRVVGGDEKGSLKYEIVKYGHENKGTRTQDCAKAVTKTAHMCATVCLQLTSLSHLSMFHSERPWTESEVEFNSLGFPRYSYNICAIFWESNNPSLSSSLNFIIHKQPAAIQVCTDCWGAAHT
jgi:hypothetical protein